MPSPPASATAVPAAARPPSPCRSARSGSGRRSARSAACAARSAGGVTSSPHLGLAAAVRVEHLADQPQLSARPACGSAGPVPARPARSRSAATTSSTLTPGWTDRSRIAPVRGGEVQHGQVGDDQPQVVEPARRRRAGRGAVVARRPQTMSTCGHEHPRRVLAHPVAGRVVDRVARRAARPRAAATLGRAQSPMHEMFWLPNRSIWLAPIITCRRPLASDVEHAAGTAASPRPPGAVPGRGPIGGDASEQVRLAVGEQQVRRDGQPGQPGAERGDRAPSGWPGSRRRRARPPRTRRRRCRPG